MNSRGKKSGRAKAVALVALAAFLLLLAGGKRGLVRLVSVQCDQRRLKREIRSLEEQKKELEAQKQALANPDTVEKIAREEYGMAKENEVIYRPVPKK
jgi:cell division protein FtsB